MGYASYRGAAVGVILFLPGRSRDKAPDDLIIEHLMEYHGWDSRKAQRFYDRNDNMFLLDDTLSDDWNLACAITLHEHSIDRNNENPNLLGWMKERECTRQYASQADKVWAFMKEHGLDALCKDPTPKFIKFQRFV
jgi:hypothetical protein